MAASIAIPTVTIRINRSSRHLHRRVRGNHQANQANSNIRLPGNRRNRTVDTSSRDGLHHPVPTARSRWAPSSRIVLHHRVPTHGDSHPTLPDRPGRVLVVIHRPPNSNSSSRHNLNQGNNRASSSNSSPVAALTNHPHPKVINLRGIRRKVHPAVGHHPPDRTSNGIRLHRDPVLVGLIIGRRILRRISTNQ